MKELEVSQKLIDTTCTLCDWIQEELKNASSVQTESILPEMIEATTRLADLVLH